MKRFWQWSATALLVAIFLSLANWQWNRASELKNPPKIDPTIVPLDSLIAPGSAITDEEYVKAGGTILNTADEVWEKSDLILKVKEPIFKQDIP